MDKDLQNPDKYIRAAVPSMAELLIAFSNWRWEFREGSRDGESRAGAKFRADLAEWLISNG